MCAHTHTHTYTPFSDVLLLCIWSENTAEAKNTKGDVNLLSLLSTFDDIIEPVTEEKERAAGSEEESKLHRTNSLEDLGIKVSNKRVSGNTLQRKTLKVTILLYQHVLKCFQGFPLQGVSFNSSTGGGTAVYSCFDLRIQ